MKDILGNNTEEAVLSFISKLDKDKRLGPHPIDNVSFGLSSIDEVLGCSSDIALKLFTEPSPFLYDEQDQIYIEVKNDDDDRIEKLYIISEKSNPSFDVMCERICESLPEITYDLECDGYPSRQCEAASLYKVMVINSLQENFYNKEINDLIDGYDFKNWICKNKNYGFTELLNKIQEEADTVSRIVIMCANNKLVADKIKKDTSYKGILKVEDAEQLRLLSEEDARINYRYNKMYERSSSIKEKILIGEQLAEERRIMLSKCSSELNILFSIYNLNQNAVPGRAKRIIRNAASMYVNDLVSEGMIKNAESAAQFKKKLISRSQKLFLSRMKEIRYKLWRDRTPETNLDSLLPKY